MNSRLFPETWERKPLRTMFERVKDLDHPEEKVLALSRDRGVVVREAEDRADSKSIYQRVLPGWLVVNRMQAWRGAVAISDEKGITSGHYLCFRPTHSSSSAFLNYLLRSDPFVAAFARISRGVRPGQPEVDNARLLSLPIPAPTLVQQRAIAEYLDRETAQIDALIVKQEQLIATLRERRVAAIASAIDHATGRRVRVKDVVALVNGYPFDAGLFRDSGDFPLVRIRDILGRRFETFLAHDQVPEIAIVRDGDLVIGMDGDFNSTLWTRGAAAMNQRVCLLRETGDASTAYLGYALPPALRVINDLTYSTTVKHLSSKQVLNITLILPSLEEQHRIVAELDEQTALIDELICKAEQFIALAKERRAALITAAVTGQIAVPGFDPDETTKAA